MFALTILLLAGAEAPGGRRYETEVFSSYDLKSNITYGQAVRVSGSLMTLLLDVYSPPSTDTVLQRPLVVFIHGGGFKDGDKVSNFGTLVCGGLARRGYVAASINYRLGSNASLISDTAYFEALYRAVQDGKAAVRFLRKNAPAYGIDPSQVYVTGSSAGSKTALHMAFLDQAEVPAFIDTTKLGNLEGSSGSPGYSSRVQGVINCWGALWDFRWINQGDVPVFNVHGTADDTVPYDSSFSYHGFTYGSTIIYQRALSVGVPAGLRLFAGTGHTLDNNTAKQDSALREFSAWLAGFIPAVTSTGVGPKFRPTPERPCLRQNYPNPFNPRTTIEYSLPVPAHVILDVVDLTGRRVAALVDEIQQGSHHSLAFDGSSLASGMYVYRLSTGTHREQKTMVLMR